jgi:hypothetical protein
MYASGFDSPAALLEDRFDHPARVIQETISNLVLDRHALCSLIMCFDHPAERSGPLNADRLKQGDL